MYRFIKILAVIGTFLLLSVVISTPASGMSFLWQGLDVFNHQGNSIYFDGNNAVMTVGNQTAMQTWKLDVVQNGLYVTEALHYNRTYTETNGHMFSVIRDYQNNGVIASEIYSFINGGIEQTILVKNLLHSNQTYLVLFNVSQSHAGQMYEQGNTIYQSRIDTSSNSITWLDSSAVEVHSSNSVISWQNAAQNFLGGFISNERNRVGINLAFTTGQLAFNESYTIDPFYQNFPVSNNVQDSSAQIWSYSNVYGSFLAGVVATSIIGNSPSTAGTTTFLLTAGASFEPNPNAPYSFGVNDVSLNVAETGNSIGYNDPISYFVENDLYQNYVDNTYAQTSGLVSALSALANAILNAYGIPFINPLAFTNHANVNKYYTNTLYRDYNAGSYFNPRLGYTTYYILGYYYDLFLWKNSYDFGVVTNTGWTNNPPSSYTINNPIIDNFQYTVQITVTDGLANNIQGTTITTSFQMGHFGQY